MERLRAAAEKAGLFDELGTSWLLLDAELLPWSAKAEQLLRDSTPPSGRRPRVRCRPRSMCWRRPRAAGLDVADLLERTRPRGSNADAFTEAYRRYCWPTDGLDGVRIAPFQLLATEGRAHHDAPHTWHLDLADRLVAADADLRRADPAGVRRHHRRGLGRAPAPTGGRS